MNDVELPTITVDLVTTNAPVVHTRRNSQIHGQVLDRLTTKDVLYGVLHAILFHRLFGTIKPTTFEVLDISMVRRFSVYIFPVFIDAAFPLFLHKIQPVVSDPETERLVIDKVDAFWRGIESGANKRGTVSPPSDRTFKFCHENPSQITVTLSEKKPKKNWFSVGEEDVAWEQWYFHPANLLSSKSNHLFLGSSMLSYASLKPIKVGMPGSNTFI